MSPADRKSRGTLALALQEVLTAVVRIRANRQTIADERGFRANMREALKAAVREARRYGYTDEEIQLGMLAVVGFLDESILNANIPALAEWPRGTLSHELFGHHLAGEIFFDNLDRLLGMQDSLGLAGVLEIYQLCLLLGFRGKFGPGKTAEIKAVADLAAERIRRIRGADETLFSRERSPSPLIPVRRTDRLRRPLMMAASVCVALAGALFVTYNSMLRAGITEMNAMVVRSGGG